MHIIVPLIIVVGGVLAMSAFKGWVRDLQFRNFPELDQISESDRESVWKTAWSEGGLRPISALILLITVVAFFACQVILSRWPASWSPGGVGNAVMRAMAYGGASIGLLPCGFLFQNRIGRAIRAELNRRGYPVCVPCGYVLRDLPAPRCPDCGAGFVIGRCTRCNGVGAVRSYMVTVIGAGILLGAAVLTAVAILNSSVTMGIIAGGVAMVGIALVCIKLFDKTPQRCPHCLGKGVIDTRRKWEPLATPAALRSDRSASA